MNYNKIKNYLRCDVVFMTLTFAMAVLFACIVGAVIIHSPILGVLSGIILLLNFWAFWWIFIKKTKNRKPLNNF